MREVAVGMAAIVLTGTIDITAFAATSSDDSAMISTASVSGKSEEIAVTWEAEGASTDANAVRGLIEGVNMSVSSNKSQYNIGSYEVEIKDGQLTIEFSTGTIRLNGIIIRELTEDEEPSNPEKNPSPATKPSTTTKPGAVTRPDAGTRAKAEYISKVNKITPESILTDAVKAATNCNTVEEIISFMEKELLNAKAALQILPDIDLANASTVDIEVMFSFDGGVTWEPATEENFPESGMDVVIPYPEKTNKDSFEFVVGHMITMACNGQKPGQMEYLESEKTEDGLKIHIMSASPFIIAWKEIVVTEEDHAVSCEDGARYAR